MNEAVCRAHREIKREERRLHPPMGGHLNATQIRSDFYCRRNCPETTHGRDRLHPAGNRPLRWVGGMDDPPQQNMRRS